MTSSVDVCNDALQYLGQQGAITSIDPPDATAHARALARFFPRARRRVLSEHAWQFATKRSAVLADVGSTHDSWAYAFTPPNDVLTPIAVLPDGYTSDKDAIPFLYEDGVIYANANGIVLRYVYDNTITEHWSEPFCEAVARRLAVMSWGLIVRGADPRNAGLLEQNAELALNYAKAHDGKFIRTDESTYVPSSIKARR